jgi:hypothetical protein
MLVGARALYARAGTNPTRFRRWCDALARENLSLITEEQRMDMNASGTPARGRS